MFFANVHAVHRIAVANRGSVSTVCAADRGRTLGSLPSLPTPWWSDCSSDRTISLRGRTRGCAPKAQIQRSRRPCPANSPHCLVPNSLSPPLSVIDSSLSHCIGVDVRRVATTKHRRSCSVGSPDNCGAKSTLLDPGSTPCNGSANWPRSPCPSGQRSQRIPDSAP